VVTNKRHTEYEIAKDSSTRAYDVTSLSIGGCYLRARMPPCDTPEGSEQGGAPNRLSPYPSSHPSTACRPPTHLHPPSHLQFTAVQGRVEGVVNRVSKHHGAFALCSCYLGQTPGAVLLRLSSPPVGSELPSLCRWRLSPAQLG